MVGVREIYQCPVTGRYYDPLRVRRALLADDGFNDLVAARDFDGLVAAARAAFPLPGIDPATGTGFTDDEAHAALSAFTDYLEKKDGTGQNSPTPAPCSGCP